MPKLFGVEVSQDVYNLSKHLLDEQPGEKTEARKDLDAEVRNNFARTFEAIWQMLDGPPLEKEFKFHDKRKWRNDYLHRPTRTIIELDGGVYNGGRHVRPKGFIDDCVKLNEATMLGYFLIRIPTGFATEHYIGRIIDHLRTAQNDQPKTTDGPGRSET